MLVSVISQSLLNRFQYNFYYCLPYSCSTSRATISLILPFKVIPDHTLHSRVKYSIAHISSVICSSNFKIKLLYKCSIWFYIFMQNYYFGYELCWVFQSSFKWSRSVHIPLNKYLLSTLTFLTVLYFEVSNLCIALTLTILPGIVDFWFLNAQFYNT